jgi:hypothetical protein
MPYDNHHYSEEVIHIVLLLDATLWGCGYAYKEGDHYRRLHPTEVRIDEKGNYYVGNELVTSEIKVLRFPEDFPAAKK